MRHYELVTILSPMLNQDESAEAWNGIKGFITNRDAEIVREQMWGTRRLAYAIHKGPHHFLEGNYFLAQFSTEAFFNQELETFLRLDERVLRSLVVATGPPAAIVEPVVAAEPIVEEAPVAEEEAEEETPVAEAELVVPELDEAPVAEEEAEEETPVAEAELVVPELDEAPVAEEEAEEETPVAEAELVVPELDEAPVAEEEAVEVAPVAEAEPVDSGEPETEEEQRPQA